MNKLAIKTVALIVAHPDDETLWAGGTILTNPSWSCFVVCLSRGSDKDRALRFYHALKVLKSSGMMGDIDDGLEQKPIVEEEMERTILNLLPLNNYDLVITHNPRGEYTRHLRHEEVSKAVITLWHAGKISAKELWTFDYEDGDKSYLPKAVEHADIYKMLTKETWLQKYDIITTIYGFEKDSWEAQTTPKTEAFRQFLASYDAVKFLNSPKMVRENIGVHG